MSDKPTESSIFDSEINRRDLLKRAGRVGAGALAAGALAGPAGAAVNKRLSRAGKKVPTGGTATWALEQDPGGIYPFGATLTINHTANEMMYDSLLEWDPKLNIKPALAASYDVINSKRIVFNLRKGVLFHNGKEFTAADAKYSFDQILNPPLPGTSATLGQVPAIAGTTALSKYKLQMDLKAPDARVYGFLAWGRYSAMVPENMYQTLNASTQGIGTGPYMLNGSYVPNDHVNYVKNPKFWKPGLPYMDGINYKIIPDEQSRIAALKAGSIDGAMVSAANAVSINGFPGLTVLHNVTAAFRELQFTIKAGSTKPWANKLVRQAINHAINRQNIIDKVYAGYGQFSGQVAAGYGPWAIPAAQLQSNYEKYDLPKAKSLMKQAGVSGFDVTMTTFSTPDDFAATAALMKNDLAQIGINVNIVTQDPVTFGANNSAGSFDWDLTARGMRGDVDGYVAEYNPSAAVYNSWFPGWLGAPNSSPKRIWKLVGNGRIMLDTTKRLPMYQTLDKDLQDESVEIGLVSVSKFFVVNKRLKNIYVAFTDFNPALRTAYIES
ncbi:MAG TPA: ABC transporter substrate-binding protein [Gaiellaceae bacterium]|jgi:peptide/nickel transport system substrate-binding protein